MSNIVIQVSDLSKQYRLGQIGTGSLAHDVNRWWYRIQGKEDPYLKIGEENERTTSATGDYVWALRNINFDVKHGEVLGIIGRNGAGKSTLLKILSRTTAPTTGRIGIKGRVASLLEVGTGFHPELTGRENIFLNGAILGMTKKEISKKFDEILDFAGVERYVDTPVKRYSSGMYVRLAFAVAAYLEPEILIVDEVLAVGDAEFQKKALGKMKDVSNKDGRTVLFVSHNMIAIKNLCDKGIYMTNGKINFIGTAAEATNKYLQQSLVYERDINLANVEERGGLGQIRITSFNIRDHDGNNIDNIVAGQPIEIHLGYSSDNIEKRNVRIIIGVYNDQEDAVARFDSHISNEHGLFTTGREGSLICSTDSINLMPGKYFLNIALFESNDMQDYLRNKCGFEIIDGDYFKTGKAFTPELAKILIKHKWETAK
jgi:lipopolysaccharide transport system ATP-binding protein